MTLEELKRQDERYANIPDGEFAFRVWNANYKDSLPMGMFADRVGLNQSQFQSMIEYGRSTGYEPTASSQATSYMPPGAPGWLAPAMKAGRGATLGLAENVTAAVGAGLEKLRGSEQPYGQAYQDWRTLQNQIMNAYSKESPMAAFGSELAGGLLTGGGIARQGQKLLSNIGIRNPLVQAGIGAGTAGGIYGFLTEEGNFRQKLAEAGKLVIPSTLFGLGGQAIVGIASPIAQKIAFSWNAATRRPALESLQRVKNAAYDAVQDANIYFEPSDMQKLYERAQLIAEFRDYVPENDTELFATLKNLAKYATQRVSLPKLDNLRQLFSERYKKSGYSEQGILDIIDQIDELIATSHTGNEAMLAARAANSAYKKAEAIDWAFDKAQRSAEGSGTGGNVQNRYRQAINTLLNSNEIRYFTNQEQQLLRDFVSGSALDNALRLVGRLDPSSSGLMAALNVGAVVANPSTMAIGGAGALSRAAAEGRTTQQAERIFQSVSTGAVPPQVQPLIYPTIPSASAGVREQELERIGR